MRALIALPAGTPSLRLLADQTAEVLAGISHALNGLALLVADPARPVPRRGGLRLRVPDWLPSLVNAGRAFVTIGAVELFWIVTEWPNGAQAITFAAISVILFAPRADQAYAAAIASWWAPALPPLSPRSSNSRCCRTRDLCRLQPRDWPCPGSRRRADGPAMADGDVHGSGGISLPLAPRAREPDELRHAQFYNTALAIVAGVGAGAFSFRLMPPLSPAFRTRRLLALTLRDLRRLATGPIPRTPDDWEGRMYGRLSACRSGRSRCSARS